MIRYAVKILNEKHELVMVGALSVDEGLAEMSRLVKAELASQDKSPALQPQKD